MAIPNPERRGGLRHDGFVLIRQGTTRNLLLRGLDDATVAWIARHMERVTLDEGAYVLGAGAAIDAVWFPEQVVTSCVDSVADGAQVEVGVMGFEGMAGWPMLLGCETSPHDVVVQGGGGTALRAPRAAFLELCGSCPAAAGVFLAYVNTLMVQFGRTAVSNLRDPVERRLARWLLMHHDRLEGDEIELTHKAIAARLGVRRAGVTNGLHALEGQDAIRNRRGHIVIRDRPALRRIAGESYGHAEAQYSRAIAPFGKT